MSREMGPRWLRARRWSGPLLIVSAVLVAMRSFLQGSMVSVQHIDLLSMWLPTFRFLGTALHSGAIPDWNPHVLAGIAFAADPQSGWTYVPAMALFATLPAGLALNAFLVLQPMLAGLGAYAFLRSEGVAASSATIGGLAIAVPLASSRLGLSVPLVGAIAWTALLLAATSKATRASRTRTALLWNVAAAICWGQVANAHLSNGLVIATIFLLAYLLVFAERRRVLTLLALLPAVNAAVLLPRISFLSRSAISLGYTELDAIGRRLSGAKTLATVGFTANDALPSLAMPPAPYLGLLALSLTFAWWRTPRLRRLGATFSGLAIAFGLLSTSWVARAARPLIGGTTIGDFYLHEPFRFGYGALLAIAVCAGVGAAALAEDRPRGVSLALALAPGAVVWAASIVASGASVADVVPYLGLGAGLVALTAQPRLVTWGLVAVFAVEVSFVGIRGSGPDARKDAYPLRPPAVPVARYLAPTDIERLLAERASQGERYASAMPWRDARGPLPFQGASWVGLGANNRAMFTGALDVGIYNPAQPLGAWLAIRSLDPSPIRYNQAFLTRPSPVLLDLLGVRWAISTSAPPWAEGPAVATAGRWRLFRVPTASGLATFPARVERASDQIDAIRRVDAGGFDPGAMLLVEGDVAEGGPGTATARWTASDRLTIDTNGVGGPLLIRVGWDPNWRASIDGENLPRFRADGFLLGISVPPGPATVTLDYDDPTIGTGAGVSLATIGGALIWAAILKRRAREEAEPQTPASIV